MPNALLPLFDSIDYIHLNAAHAVLPDMRFEADFLHTLNFLKSYNGSLGTFNSYRREAERLLQWAWHIKQLSITQLKRDALEEYIHFCQNPPAEWISAHKVPRFIVVAGQRQPNPVWRPFIKSHNKQSLSQAAVQEIFAILSTFFNFLIAEEYVFNNPIALMRQKSKFLRKTQHTAPIRRLSEIQWQAVLNAVDELALADPEKHERTRFMLSLLYGMYLRISELAASPRWTPCMNHFFKDAQGHWWFTTVGKGNKQRQIAVSDAMLASLTRWRLFLSLTALPSPADNSPLLPKMRGPGPLSDTAPIRRIIQQCFDRAEQNLRAKQQYEEADALSVATVHWLRHTGISDDIRTRPREHVRDDAGHSSSVTTDRYIDVELAARHASARKKTITPS
jgi:site-specific recombinase XerD